MSENVVDLDEERKKRLLEELQKLPAYDGPVIDCGRERMSYCVSAFGDESKNCVSAMCFDCSDGIARDIGVIRFNFKQWKEFRHEIDRIVDFHEKQLKK